MPEHYFEFSTNWRNHKRLCGECNLTYKEGNHIPVALAHLALKPRTVYHCPQGHMGRYTGSLDTPELRRPDDDRCLSCGELLVEEDNERWRLTFEAKTPLDPEWHQVSVVRSKHAAHEQRDGLLKLIDRGELIRNVELVKLEVREVRGG